MDRLDKVSMISDQLISQMAGGAWRRYATQHLHGVSEISIMLAKKRGLQPELAGVAGIMHDLYSLTTYLTKFHDQNGAEMIRPMLRDMKLFDSEEQRTIVSAVFHHCDKEGMHGAYEELLKDADVLQTWQSDPAIPVNPDRIDRLSRLLVELGTPAELEAYDIPPKQPKAPRPKNYRKKIAAIAEELASLCIKGVDSDAHYSQICRYWPGHNVQQELRGKWCAAFVYHCCYETGLMLPIRHPLVSCRFAAVKAWLEWSQLPETGYWLPREHGPLQLERGDLVIYDRLLSDGPHDHIGVVLKVGSESITVAEGNSDNNRSAVLQRTMEHVAGVIRMDGVCKYNAKGRYYDPSVLGG